MCGYLASLLVRYSRSRLLVTGCCWHQGWVLLSFWLDPCVTRGPRILSPHLPVFRVPVSPNILSQNYRAGSSVCVPRGLHGNSWVPLCMPWWYSLWPWRWSTVLLLQILDGLTFFLWKASAEGLEISPRPPEPACPCQTIVWCGSPRPFCGGRLAMWPTGLATESWFAFSVL